MVKNLCKVTDDEKPAEATALHPTMEQIEDFQQIKKVGDLSPVELKELLLPRMKEKGLPTENLDILEQSCISGDVFLSLDEKDIQEILPNATFGIRRFLSIQVKQLSEPSVILENMENLREFDVPVSHLTVYRKGLCCDVSNFARDKTTRPLKLFYTIEESSNCEIPNLIASEVVPFASACLNQRRNGTIFFGINNTYTDLHKLGEIVGISLVKEEFSTNNPKESGASREGNLTQQAIQNELNYYIQQSFLPSHLEIIKHTVRDAKFIPVIAKENPMSNLYVVEVDVNASSELLKKEKIPTILKLLPIHGKKSKMKDGIFTLSSDGKPRLLDAGARQNFERDHPGIVAQREQDEVDDHGQSHVNLRMKFLNLFTGGDESITDMMFYFLVLSPPAENLSKERSESNSLNIENLQFIKCLGPEIVFDFDPQGSERGIYSMLKTAETTRVLTTDNFDESKHSSEEIKEQGNSLAIENKIIWFFCNGYAPMDILPLSPVDWIKKRKYCFQECLRLFISTFGKNRVTVLICLMSKDCDILIDASGEILAKLSDNWMVLAESEDVAKNWQRQMLHRNWVEEQDLYDRCVIGMPWADVNNTIQQAKKPTPSDICYIPTSNGVLIEVKEKKIKDWCHIDVLSAEFKPHEDIDYEMFSKNIEEKFYRGEQAQWANFYFERQVLVRDKHERLLHLVKEALKSPGRGKRNKVVTVNLIHQPMAGATTSAKQVLWVLRKLYRCCVVKTISEHTAQNLNELHKYNEKNPKPLLILIDNEDEDKLAQLLNDLEDQGQKTRNFDIDDTYEVYCVAIICRRRTSIGKYSRSNKDVCLVHELSRNELQWFKEKDLYLNQRFEEDKISFTNPKFLIAFNIMKKRFDSVYIEKTLSMFTDSVVEEREVKLLKIVSFLNLYDPFFTKISVSCLDDLLLDKEQKWGTKKTLLIRNQKWEACLSPEVKVLLNLSSENCNSKMNRTTVCIFNKVIAQGVFNRIMERTHQKVSEVLLELLDSSMFVQKKHDTESLISIVNNIVKTRLVGRIKSKFSQFVMDLSSSEGPRTAVNVLEQVFEMNNDPFTAQLIARFYMIELKSWDDAEFYAERARSKVPTNTYLWDTNAQVYQCQLQDEISDTTKSVTRNVIQHWISLSIKSLDIFRKIEEINDQKCEEYEPLLSCYFGELRAIELILQGISNFSSSSSLHKFLVEPDFIPEELAFLTHEERTYLKSLQAISDEAFTRLNDESVQMKKTVDFTLDTHNSDYDHRALGKLSSSLENFFGQNNIAMKSPEKEFYNYSLAKKHGGTHLNQLLNLRENGCFLKLKKIYELMQENIKHETAYRFNYLLSAVGSCTLLLLQNMCPPDLDFNTLLSLCQSLVESNKKRPRGRCFLEPYLYYIMYNFPTEERKKLNICSSCELKSIIKAGTEAFMANNPNYAGRRFRKRRVTTMFFLGTKSPLHDIVHQDMLQGMENQPIEDKWSLPELAETLRQLRGTLLKGGDKVRFSSFEIQTAYRIENTSMWQKPVNFYVGFSWAGPLAYGVKSSD